MPDGNAMTPTIAYCQSAQHERVPMQAHLHLKRNAMNKFFKLCARYLKSRTFSRLTFSPEELVSTQKRSGPVEAIAKIIA